MTDDESPRLIVLRVRIGLRVAKQCAQLVTDRAALYPHDSAERKAVLGAAAAIDAFWSTALSVNELGDPGSDE